MEMGYFCFERKLGYVTVTHNVFSTYIQRWMKIRYTCWFMEQICAVDVNSLHYTLNQCVMNNNGHSFLSIDQMITVSMCLYEHVRFEITYQPEQRPPKAPLLCYIPD